MSLAASPVTRPQPVRSLPALPAIVAVSLALFWRRPDALANPQFWAEDGNVFFMQVNEGGIATLSVPYAGYFHLAARTTAWATSWLPVEYAPHAYAFASWLLLALLVAYICSDRLNLEPGERIVLALALVGTTTDNEVFFNLANWATLAAPWWILLATAREPERPTQTAFDIALLLIAGLSTPFAVGLWLLFALRLALRRTRHSAVLFGISLTVAVLQVWHMGTRIAEPSAGPLFTRIDGFAYRLVFVFFGEAIYRIHLASAERVLILGGFAATYALMAWWAWARGTKATLIFLLAHVVTVAVSFFVTRTWTETDFIGHRGRHQYLPAVTLVWAFACLRLRPAQWLPVGLAFAAFVFLNPGNKREVRYDLQWKMNVARCRSEPGPCRIPIHPITPPPPVWTVTIPKGS